MKVIRESFFSEPLLASCNRISLADLPKGTTLLEKKMGAGGVNTSEIALLKDFKFSAEKMLQEWMWKYGLRRLAAGMTTCSFLLRTIVLRPPHEQNRRQRFTAQQCWPASVRTSGQQVTRDL